LGNRSGQQGGGPPRQLRVLVPRVARDEIPVDLLHLGTRLPLPREVRGTGADDRGRDPLVCAKARYVIGPPRERPAIPRRERHNRVVTLVSKGERRHRIVIPMARQYHGLLQDCARLP